MEHPQVSEVINVALVEDDERLRAAMVFQLTTAGLRLSPYPSAEAFLDSPEPTVFECIVIDLLLPRMNGLQLQEEIKRAAPFSSVIFISGHGDLRLGMEAMRKGAVDFLEKPIDEPALLNSIARGAEISRSRRAEYRKLAELQKRQDLLTSREREVFAQITIGLLNKQVAIELGTTERTIKAHRERVMSKMEAGSLADLVRMAEILGIHQAVGPKRDNKAVRPQLAAAIGKRLAALDSTSRASTKQGGY
jgi:FixJ family two-component response regulator